MNTIVEKKPVVKTGVKTVEIRLKDIEPDENQPRKYFDLTTMRSLRESIKRFGILTPLRLEQIGDKYLIEDGERRFRTAKELKLETVPAVILPPVSSTERLIRQFHIQEHHDEWTATEKAITVWKLTEEIGSSMEQISSMLGIDEHTVRRYRAFANLVAKKEFERNRVPLGYAEGIERLKNTARKIYNDSFEEEFNRGLERKLEEAVISRISNGDIRRSSQLTKIRDSFVKEPKSVKEFMETKITPESLFIKTKAKGAYHLRNLVNHARYFQGHAGVFLKTGDVKLSPSQISDLKGMRTTLAGLLNKVE